MKILHAAVILKMGTRLAALRCRASAQAAHFFVIHLVWLDNSQPVELSLCRRAVEKQWVVKFDRKEHPVDQRDWKYFPIL